MKKVGKIIELDYDFILSLDTEKKCYSLDTRTVSILLSQLDYLHWQTRWYSPTNATIVQDTIDALADACADQLMDEDECMPESNCCPDQVDAINRLYSLMLQQADTGSAQSFAPDAPTNYNGNAGQSPAQLAQRNAALCAAVIGYIVAVLQQAATAAAGAAASTAIALLISLFTGQYWMLPAIAAVSTGYPAASLLLAIVDERAIRRVACAMYEGLKGETTNQANFAASLAGTAFDGNEAIIAGVVGLANTLPDNYRNFTMRLGANYDLSGQSDDSACICCDDGAPVLKASFGTLTKTGAFSYRANSARELNGNDKLEVQIVGELGSCGMCIKTVTLQPNKSYGTPGVTYADGVATNELAATGMCLYSFKVHVLNGYGQDGPFYTDFTICDTSCEINLDCVDCE